MSKSRLFSFISIIGVTILIMILFSGCKSKQKTVERKKESVSELQQNDIQSSSALQRDIETFHLAKNETFNLVPVDNGKPVRVIRGKDTMQFSNARVSISNSETETTTVDKSTERSQLSDNSRREYTRETKELKKDKESTGTHPALIWGLLLLLLIAGILWYFKKKIPFL
ncbi:hypothetical protein [Salegentibacter sp. BDJ18]|uniref:hypothetical protein n=1 Tax=Salegentibacter sp. BDJ18 TaxID=2816376 RepID=UPI001AAF6703|nr:hypothetical protein [Salegentibacter sp. BDJ18]